MNGKHFGHVGDAYHNPLNDPLPNRGAAPNFSQDEVDYLKAIFPCSVEGTARTLDEVMLVSHNCAKIDGILSVINHIQALIDARKAQQ